VTGLAGGLLALLLAPQAAAPAAEPTRAATAPARASQAAPPARSGTPVTPPPGRTSEPALTAMWADYVRLRSAGKEEEATRELGQIRRQRIERTIPSLDTVGLGLVEEGVARMGAGEREPAEQAFRAAVDLAPGLPDGHYGLSVVRLKKGVLGIVPSLRAMWSGLGTFLPTARGGLRALEFLVVAGLFLMFAVTWVVSGGLLLRHGGLLRHDLEEWLGPSQHPSASLALFLLLILLPVVAFQGWGWLPLWWLALLFTYFGGVEKTVAALTLLLVVATGSGISTLESRLETARNPLFWAAMSAVEGEPDGSEMALLVAGAREHPEDRDLAYLVAVGARREGRYAEAAELYGSILHQDPGDPVARNNLANVEFAWGAYDQALARYRAGATAGGRPDVVATFFYNLSIAHLQKFEYQAYNEARSNADRLAPYRIAEYDRWRYDSGDYAVVDLGLTRQDVWRKFRGAPRGVAVANVFGAEAAGGTLPEPSKLLNRFTGFALVVGVVVLVIGRLRGPRAFTVHCSMCGTAFCRQCHLGQGAATLCSQCHHLFVVRDGVSGPARNRKMTEVQESTARRGRVFRVLSVVSPGAGHIYARATVLGVLLVITWNALVAALVAEHLVPLAEVSRQITPPWGGILLGLLLVAVWVLANRLRPDLEGEVPTRRSSRRGPRPAQG
jgi:hypothetical protein